MRIFNLQGSIHATRCGAGPFVSEFYFLCPSEEYSGLFHYGQYTNLFGFVSEMQYNGYGSTQSVLSLF